jgi:hypothetical protein
MLGRTVWRTVQGLKICPYRVPMLLYSQRRKRTQRMWSFLLILDLIRRHCWPYSNGDELVTWVIGSYNSIKQYRGVLIYEPAALFDVIAEGVLR